MFLLKIFLDLEKDVDNQRVRIYLVGATHTHSWLRGHMLLGQFSGTGKVTYK